MDWLLQAEGHRRRVKLLFLRRGLKMVVTGNSIFVNYGVYICLFVNMRHST